MLTVKQIHDKNYETVYELTNSKGLKVLTSPFGARLLAIQVPLKEELRDIVVAPKDLVLTKRIALLWGNDWTCRWTNYQ
ncbi:hypothetical protein V4S40_08585 [Enterococcus cecorum]